MLLMDKSTISLFLWPCSIANCKRLPFWVAAINFPSTSGCPSSSKSRLTTHCDKHPIGWPPRPPPKWPVVKTCWSNVINHPFGDGFYHLFHTGDDWGMVYCFSNHIKANTQLGGSSWSLNIVGGSSMDMFTRNHSFLSDFWVLLFL